MAGEACAELCVLLNRECLTSAEGELICRRMSTLIYVFQGVVSCMCCVAVSLGRIQREVKQQETDVIREGTRSDSD